jgi:2-hydroxy-6-oxonona-2,4-dienedioate hydrolase
MHSFSGNVEVNMEHGKFVTLNVSEHRIKTHYHEIGGSGNPPVVFAQTGGAGTSAYMCWYLNMEAFANAGFHVLAPDFVGFGYTENISGAGDRVNTTEMLSVFMDALGIDKAHFVGNSMGSNAVTKLAIECPIRVKSLILTGGEPRVESEESRTIASNLGKTARTDFVREMLSKPEVSLQDIRRTTADFFYDPDHPRIDEIAKMRLEILRRSGMREKARDHAFKQTERGRSNFQASELKKIHAPTYLIHGRDERLFYSREIGGSLLKAAMEVALIVPSCSLTVLSACAHWPQIEKADTFNALALQFLNDLDGRR